MKYEKTTAKQGNSTYLFTPQLPKQKKTHEKLPQHIRQIRDSVCNATLPQVAQGVGMASSSVSAQAGVMRSSGLM